MQQTAEQVVNKIKTELDEIKVKIIKLETFLVCDDFQEISEAQQKLLKEQWKIMNDYKVVLLNRIAIIQKENKNDKT